MNPIGIMQGRLSPPVDGKIQAFPWNTWEDEFREASAIGFSEIEFIFEVPNWENNPLLTGNGIKKMKKLTGETGVKVNYICADYYMERPFFRVVEKERKQSVAILIDLLKQCARIGISGVEVPLVDNSRIETREEAQLLIKSLRECLPVAEAGNIKLPLETSLPPSDFKALLEEINHNLVKANYDTGNSASLGFDPQEEIQKLGPWIDNVHIKDRIRGGCTVPLGKGNTDFNTVFEELNRIGYKGAFILQTARGENDVKVAKKYLDYTRRYIRKYMS